ncbi:MAG: ABC transporter permease [Clostridiales Family XIII bacterium]|jgi:hypothetical protein|nr:ABC transporter permease [Clostridiales Family XIII bacterium]
MRLFLKECNAIRGTIPWIAFVVIVIGFYFMNFGFELDNQILQTNARKDVEFETKLMGITIFNEYYKLADNPLISPDEMQDYGDKKVIVPEVTMPNALALLATEYLYERGDYFFAGYSDISGEALYERRGYAHYNKFGFLHNATISDEERAEIAGIIKSCTGLTPEEIYERISDGLAQPLPFVAVDDYRDRVTVDVSYPEFEKMMGRVDEIIGGGSSYAYPYLESQALEPVKYGDRLSEYQSLIHADKVTNAYARYFCDYMGIVIALFAIFVSVNYLLRDRRSKSSELVMPRDISSVRLVVTRYLAAASMAFLPIAAISIIPATKLAAFGQSNGIATDAFAFLKYEVAWLLPTILFVTGVGFIVTILTDTPAAIIIQFVWSYILLIVTPISAPGGISGMGLIVRFNAIGDSGILQEHIGDLVMNRVTYTLLAAVLLLVSVHIFRLKREGRIDIAGKIKHALSSDKNTVQDCPQ